MRRLLLALCFTAFALTAPAQVLRSQAVGTGANRATAPGHALFSWVGMGLQGPQATGSTHRAAPGWPGILIGMALRPPVTASQIVDYLLGLSSPSSLAGHDRNGDGEIDVGDVVRAVNEP